MYALRPGEYVLKFLKIMRLGIYLVLLTTFTVSANGFSQKVKVTPQFRATVDTGNYQRTAKSFGLPVFVPGG